MRSQDALFGAAAITLTCVAPVWAGVYSPALVESPDNPATWSFATPIASLDALATGYAFPENSGFAWYFDGIPLASTEVETTVYRITDAQTIGSGSATASLEVGDLVFAYRIKLVTGVPSGTVSTLVEAQVIGAPLFGFGQDLMPASFINGQGFVTPSHTNVPDQANQTGDDTFGSSIDFEWPGGDNANLDNNQEITLLMFSGPASIGQGVMNLFAPPGQVGGLTGIAQGNEAPPVLIPIVPTPGAIGLLAAAGVFAGSRRRRI